MYAPADAVAGFEQAVALIATWSDQTHVFGAQGDDQVSLPAAERDRLLESTACRGWFRQHPLGELGGALPAGGMSGCSAATNAR